MLIFESKILYFLPNRPFNHIVDKLVHGKNVPETRLHVCLFFSEGMKSSMKS